MVRCWIFALAALAVCLQGAPAIAASDDAVVSQFFRIWNNNARVTLANVRSLYATRVTYYGQRMSAEGVYADKLRFIRHWPARHYALVPGTVAKGCNADQTQCRVTAILSYTAASDRRSVRGRTRVILDLVREDGELKIARERGQPV